MVSDKETTTAIAKAIESNSELIKEIYGDFAKPGVSQVGKALGSALGLVNTILSPIQFLNGKVSIYFEHSLDKYRSSIQNIPMEQIIDVIPEIGVPILEKLSYISADELSDMYINLLLKASRQQTSCQAHPSFVLALSSLSSDEAVFLKTISCMTELSFIEIVQINKPGQERVDHTLMDYVIHSSLMKGLMHKNNIGLYVSNLVSLGVLEISRYQYRPDKAMYCTHIWDELKAYRKCMSNQIPETTKISYKECSAKITPFGKLFIAACLG